MLLRHGVGLQQIARAMTRQHLILGVVLLVAGGVAVASLRAHGAGRRAGVGRTLTTQRVLRCDGCGAQSPVSQSELLRSYRPDTPRDRTGEPLVECPSCRRPKARLAVEAVHE